MSTTIESTGTELTVLDSRALVAAEVFAPGGVQAILKAIREEVAKKNYDASTPEARAVCRAMAHKIARSKTALDRMGKDLTEEWRERTSKVNEDRRKIEREMDALRDQVRKPLTDWENAEKERVASHEAALEDMATLAISPYASTTEVDDALVRLNAMSTTRAWQEFQQRASDTFADVSDRLNVIRSQKVAAAKAAEEEAERKRLADEAEALRLVQEQQAREERIAAEAAERAKFEAEREAERLRQEEASRAQRAQAEAAERAAAIERRAEQAEKDRQAAQRAARDLEEKIAAEQVEAEARAKRREEAAVEAERRRAETAKRQEAEATAARERNIAHKRTINREAVAALMSITGMAGEDAVGVIAAIAKGQIPNVKISY